MVPLPKRGSAQGSALPTCGMGATVRAQRGATVRPLAAEA